MSDSVKSTICRPKNNPFHGVGENIEVETSHYTLEVNIIRHKEPVSPRFGETGFSVCLTFRCGIYPLGQGG